MQLFCSLQNSATMGEKKENLITQTTTSPPSQPFNQGTFVQKRETNIK